MVKRKITPEEDESLLNLRLEWIRVSHESQRHYPKGTLAAHVLGSVDFEEKGNAGIEKGLDERPARQARPHAPADRREAPRHRFPGNHAGETRHCRSRSPSTSACSSWPSARSPPRWACITPIRGSVVVMNPYNGDILAMASYPTFDPNLPLERGQDPKPRMNHAISVPFEPGSVFKVITLSAALETTNLRPESLINCHGGEITFGSRTIHDSHAGMGVVPMATVLAKSSNVGAIQVGLRVGQQNMYDYMRRFGFGQKTGIPLPGESPGWCASWSAGARPRWPRSRWGRRSA